MKKFIQKIKGFFVKPNVSHQVFGAKDETEFTFIWYKKMQSGGKTHYTQPFRTKVKAKTREEAKDKVINFAMAKMTLQVIEEKDFDSTELMKLQKEFDKLNEQFTKITDDLFAPKTCG